ncbi:16S rRNA (guanine(966)-N(2))-methyltransferase RsmD [Nannocystis pusilla]|uniref:16S rRNA (Guanine(966)-N(2))-methyltransferase RsmD n=1 Tax=Nannocystis pusilla TaxID=889268 RepID=A0ABS7U3Z3_9BACT|nr:16S rRNA (guanine(966)-N(2))-methyltransferase RsmD [Nannocystis pusilla]
MQRISGGSLRGRVLKSLPTVPGLRPTGARVREAIFDRLQHELRDAVVLDLFAGSGALAFEALSRGASRATLVERNSAVARHLQAQIRELALGDRARLWHGDATTFLRRDAASANAADLAGPYDLVFVDPPYEDTAAVLAAVLPALVARGWLAESAALVCEYDRAGGRTPPAWPPGLVVETTRHYGQTAVEFLRHTLTTGAREQC